MPKPWKIEPVWQRLTIEVQCGRRARYGLDWACGRKRFADDFSRLYTLEAGEARVSTPDQEMHLVPGRLYLIPAGCPAKYNCIKPMVLLWLHFRVEAIYGIDVFSRYRPADLTALMRGGHRRLNKLLRQLGRQDPRFVFENTALLCELLRPFLPEHWEDLLPPDDKLKRLQPAMALLQASIRDRVSLAELAAVVNLQPTYFSNLFKAVYGVPPLQHLQDLRLRQARALLTASKVTVSEVARRCGFADPLYFSRVFRRHVGVSPRQYQQQGGRLEP